MRKLLLIPALLSLAILFVACGDKKPDLPVTLIAAAEKTFDPLIAPANTSPTSTVEFRLEDFPGISEYKKWISKVEFVFTSSYFQFTGLTDENIELKDVTFSLSSNSGINLRIPETITGNEKIDIDSEERLRFMQAVMDEVKNTGSSKVVLKYTPATTMLDVNAKVTMKMNARFFFN